MIKFFKCNVSERVVEEIKELQRRMTDNEKAWLEKRISMEKFDEENMSITGKAKFTLGEILHDCKEVD